MASAAETQRQKRKSVFPQTSLISLFAYSVGGLLDLLRLDHHPCRDEGHREGWCLYHLGCKGPETYGNCSTLQFCDVGGVWPVAIGHPCYGCNEEGIGFHKGIHQLANVENQTPRSQKPDVNAKEGGNVSAGAIGLLGGVVGLVAGVSVMAVRELGRQQKKDNADSRGE